MEGLNQLRKGTNNKKFREDLLTDTFRKSSYQVGSQGEVSSDHAGNKFSAQLPNNSYNLLIRSSLK
jgi:hypothetical protein